MNNNVVNLPNILLAKIINELKDNLDKLYLTLVCKRWFDIRDSILSFDCQDCYLVKFEQKRFFLKSYISTFNHSYMRKDNGALLFGSSLAGKRFHYRLNYRNKYRVPNSTREIYFDAEFNLNIDNMLMKLSMSNVTHIYFNDNFKQPIAKGLFPPTIKLISFGYYWNHPIDEGVLPAHLESLSFIGCFNQPINEKSLPSTIKHLKLSVLFDYKHLFANDKLLPCNLQSLDIPRSNKELIPPGFLPANLTEIKSLFVDELLLPSVLPSSIRSISLDIGSQTNRLAIPIGVTSLTIDSSSNGWRLKNVDLPTTLRCLTLEDYNHQLEENDLPNDIEELTLVNYHINNLPIVNSKSIKTLKLLLTYVNTPLEIGCIPQGVEQLTFDLLNGIPLAPHIIPDSVRDLSFPTGRVKLVVGSLPPALQSLTFDGDVVTPLLSNDLLPPSLERLTISIQQAKTSLNLDINTLFLTTKINTMKIMSRSNIYWYIIRRLDQSHAILSGGQSNTEYGIIKITQLNTTISNKLSTESDF
ncbi:hypothetical protein PPL_03896 [Heterostelium album PN500]|uniref:F-box domain-containing protein n=1 Tax=Heterostelium pallidum (strain ATCC 26659 / Pp 5 / PN500) TaxID=670386 RepID=D3B5F8_HETP5|nr:hypothetical protein PPL_03896 [Heterostelium album PN500]EFA83106.1 hypothetical protein PPL_03896 [Heterostelium album PN500]|eukprot:XP_020435223.1 hypothetical protein PPL_03896 [Heterostelium album PN500]